MSDNVIPFPVKPAPRLRERLAGARVKPINVPKLPTSSLTELERALYALQVAVELALTVLRQTEYPEHERILGTQQVFDAYRSAR